MARVGVIEATALIGGVCPPGGDAKTPAGHKLMGHSNPGRTHHNHSGKNNVAATKGARGMSLSGFGVHVTHSAID